MTLIEMFSYCCICLSSAGLGVILTFEYLSAGMKRRILDQFDEICELRKDNLVMNSKIRELHLLTNSVDKVVYNSDEVQ